MPTLDIKGVGKVKVGDDFLKLSPEDQARTVDEIVTAERGEQTAQPAPEAVSAAPPEGIGAGERFVRGLKDPIDAGAQLATHALPQGVVGAVNEATRYVNELPYIGPVTQALGMVPATAESIDKDIQAAEQGYQARRGPDAGIDWARIGGNIAATAPLAAAVPGVAAASLPVRVAAGVGGGAGSGALQPVQNIEGDDYWQQKGVQTAIGAATGGVAPAVTSGVARVVKPKVDAAVQKLRELGVSPTVGQTLGGAAKRIEEGATSIPLLGDIIKTAQRRSVLGYNRGILNKALEPIGKSLPKDMPVGREAIERAGETISQAYDDIVPKLTAKVDTKFLTDMQNLRGLTTNMLPQRAEQLERILQEQLARKIPQSGVITGQTLKEAESSLGRLASDFGKSLDADQRLLGDALKEAQSVLRHLVERSNPQARESLKAVNTAYARLLRVENAAGRAGSKEGVFSPAAFRGATKAMDKSLRKRATARGGAMMQDIAEAGESVLGPTVPDSGTPLRLLTGAGLLGGAPLLDPVWGSVGAGSALAYTPVGQRLLAALLTSRPAGADALAAGIRASTPALTATGPALLADR